VGRAEGAGAGAHKIADPAVNVRGLVLDAHLVSMRCLLPFGMRALSLTALFRTITPRAGRVTRARAGQALARSERLARCLGAHDTCLYRAIARWVALRSAGLPAEFVMGVRQDDPGAGHAWVEIGGAPVGEDPDPRLVVTFRFA
jgi:hypothetical protein